MELLKNIILERIEKYNLSEEQKQILRERLKKTSL